MANTNKNTTKKQKLNNPPKSGVRVNKADVQHYRHEANDYETVKSREERVTATGRVLVTGRDSMKGKLAWRDGHDWEPLDDPKFALDSNRKEYDEALKRSPLEEPLEPKASAKRSKQSRRPHLFWMEKYRDKYLDECLRQEGRGDFGFEGCPDCEARGVKEEERPKGVYRCKTCSPDLVCASCCVRRHRREPLHHIQFWSNGTFKDSSLASIGLIWHLNHLSNPCPNPQKAHQHFQIIHTNGIHHVNVMFCGCNRTIPHYQQLMRRRIYPSTQGVIRTCATFEALDLLHMLSLVTKAGTYDLYRTLQKLTFNGGVDSHKPRYRALQRMLLQWRHLKMLKRAGRGHEPDGIANTKDGDLAILCPSCPRPGVNLPEGWNQAPKEKRFLYALYLCLDFNFRLKNQLVSSWTRDPGLGDGWAYFVPRKPYEDHIARHMDEKDVSTCVGFAALAQRTTRSSKGLRYTGVGAVLCARSEMVMPNGVCNLEKGERYCNSDIIFAFVMRRYLEWLLLLIVAYDIMCQWMVNLSRRMQNWPQEMRLPSSLYMTPVIPKFHHPAHQEDKEHDRLNCNYAKGLGDCDCECAERMWSSLNPAAPSTKPMGPGSRVLVLNDHFGFYNWGKYVGTGTTLARRYLLAVKTRNQQTEAHRGLTASLPQELRSCWEQICQQWEDSKRGDKAIDPFRPKKAYLSQRQVEKELAEYESDRLRAGGISYHNTSASAFLTLGLELEDSQRKLVRIASGGSNSTDTQSKSLTEQRSVLRTKIRNWSLIRHIYMPGLLRALQEMDEGFPDLTADDLDPERIPLWLPSTLPGDKRSAACQEGLENMEERLREAQCADALDSIRHTLKLKARMLQFKYANVTGQRQGVKSRTTINRIHERAKSAAQTYRAARAALLALRGKGEWELKYRELKDSDVRSYVDPEQVKQGPGRQGTQEDEVGEERPSTSAPASQEVDGSDIDLIINRRDKEVREEYGTGETRSVLLWIWLNGDIDRMDGTDANDEVLREVWAKSRARAARASEAIALVKEEMQRSMMSLTYSAKAWRKRIGLRGDVSPALQEGLTAYALRQERIQLRLERAFQAMWSKPLSEMEGMTMEGDEAEKTGDGAGDDEDDEDDDDALAQHGLPPDISRYEYRTEHGTGETRKVNSWIWEYGQGRNKIGLDDGADDDNEILRAEWCKSRARLHRATEEVELLKEEMKRALCYLEWAANRWDDMAGQLDNATSGGLREGRKAYAIKQARIQRRLRDSFENLWNVPLGNWDEAQAVKEEEEERIRSERGDASDEELDEEEEGYGEDYEEEDATGIVDGEANEPVARLRSGRKSSGGPSTSSKRKRAVGVAGTRSKRAKAQSTHSVLREVTSEPEEPASDAEEGQEPQEEVDDGAVVVAADAPAYIWKVVHMCDLLRVGEEMKDLLQSWVNLEAAAKYEGNGILMASSRPAQITEWIQHGRRPNFKPKISGVEQYGDKFRSWLQKCCPEWRAPKQGSVLVREPGQDWSQMKITGQNGLASIIVATAFWRHALDGVPGSTPREKQARDRLEDQYRAAFEEVSEKPGQITQAQPAQPQQNGQQTLAPAIKQSKDSTKLKKTKKSKKGERQTECVEGNSKKGVRSRKSGKGKKRADVWDSDKAEESSDNKVEGLEPTKNAERNVPRPRPVRQSNRIQVNKQASKEPSKTPLSSIENLPAAPPGLPPLHHPKVYALALRYVYDDIKTIGELENKLEDLLGNQYSWQALAPLFIAARALESKNLFLEDVEPLYHPEVYRLTRTFLDSKMLPDKLDSLLSGLLGECSTSQETIAPLLDMMIELEKAGEDMDKGIDEIEDIYLDRLHRLVANVNRNGDDVVMEDAPPSPPAVPPVASPLLPIEDEEQLTLEKPRLTLSPSESPLSPPQQDDTPPQPLLAPSSTHSTPPPTPSGKDDSTLSIQASKNGSTFEGPSSTLGVLLSPHQREIQLPGGLLTSPSESSSGSSLTPTSEYQVFVAVMSTINMDDLPSFVRFTSEGVEDRFIKGHMAYLLDEGKEEPPAWERLVFKWIDVKSIWTSREFNGQDMSKKGRPESVSWWFSYGRLRTARTPAGVTVEEMEAEWWQWWTNANPEWRVKVDGKVVPGGVGSWDKLRAPGPNGIVLFLVALRWWHEVSESTEELGRWELTVKSIFETLSSLHHDALLAAPPSPTSKKRSRRPAGALAPEETGHVTKRRQKLA
ncbi:hypothetical protein V5O48_010552 [Marasmius crinis-equi]|uniref:CxC2-like cysteine cluster KDZ transposase-associated domain-containing protein n=1 Tax=Marasmius crinis-equi TaxID=585013 RepID=A0ABR3F837_9AGAR